MGKQKSCLNHLQQFNIAATSNHLPEITDDHFLTNSFSFYFMEVLVPIRLEMENQKQNKVTLHQKYFEMLQTSQDTLELCVQLPLASACSRVPVLPWVEAGSLLNLGSNPSSCLPSSAQASLSEPRFPCQ